MTPEKETTINASTSTDFRQRLALFHNTKAKTKQARVAMSVPTGARCRSAIATKSARGAWWRNGRMMKAGTKNKALPTTAKTEKPTHRFVFRFRAGCRIFGIFDYASEFGHMLPRLVLKSRRT